MGKGTNQTTNSTTTAPAPQAAAAYNQLLNQAGNVASTPYQAYTGELTAPVNAQQTAGISGINQNANFAQPAVNQAIGIAGNAANPLTSQQIQQYQNPYTQDVVNATQAQFNNQNAQQQAGVTGNAISQGALGGNRVGVAQSNLANQQQLAQAPVIAGLYNQSYNTGLATAENQFQQNPLAAAGSLANFGISGQNAALSGAGAQLGAGTLQQQTQQAQDAAAYQQYAQAQAYPFQTTQWLAGLDTGVGSQLGGTSNGQTTAPAPNFLSQILGLGTAGIGAAGQAGLFAGLSDRRAKDHIHEVGKTHDGQPLYRYKYKGSDEWHIGPMAQEVEKDHPEAVHHGVGGLKYVDLKAATDDSIKRAFGGAVGVAPHMAVGGTPWGDAQGWVPTVNIAHGSGAPHASAPGVASQTGGLTPANTSSVVSGISGMFNNPAYGGGNIFTNAYGGSSSNPLPGLDASDYGTGFNRGGVVGYADGGSPDFSDRFDPAVEQPFGDMPRGEALGLAGLGSTGIAPQPVPGSQGAPTYDDGQGAFRLHPDAVVTGDKTALKGTGVSSNDDSDAETTEGATPISGRGTPSGGTAGVAGPSQFTPPYQITPEDYGRASTPTANPWAALTTAGLSMLANRSPFLGVGVGEGALAGLQSYGSAQEADRKAAQDAQKLSLEAKEKSNELALNTFKLNEQVRHTKFEEEQGYKPTFGVVREEQDPDTGINHKVYGWIDPNTKQIVEPTSSSQPSTATAVGRNPPVDNSGQIVTGQPYLDWLNSLSPKRAAQAKLIGDYKENPAILSRRGNSVATAITDASRYNPDYDQRFFTGSNRAMSNFMGGQEGRAVRSLNVATDHLDTLDQAAVALKNGEYPKFNQLVNYFRTQGGSPLATNFDSIKQAVSAEIAKSVVGGPTALHDREDMAHRANNASSPEQLKGITDEFRKLMAGQMNGLRKSYEVGTRAKNFDDFLLPATKKALSAHKDEPDSYNQGAEPAGGEQAAPPAAPAGAVAKMKDTTGKYWYVDKANKPLAPVQ